MNNPSLVWIFSTDKLISAIPNTKYLAMLDETQSFMWWKLLLVEQYGQYMVANGAVEHLGLTPLMAIREAELAIYRELERLALEVSADEILAVSQDEPKKRL